MFNTNLPWYLRMPNRLRTVAPGTDAGGTDGENGGQSGTDDTDDGTDWKAKFEAERAHSRKWEQRAKDNSKAAEELEQLKETQTSEAEKTAKHTKELEAKVAAYEAEKQQNEWRSQVSKETGVPAELLHGDSLEAMSEYAKALDQWAHPKPKGMPDQGRTPAGKPAGTETRDFVNRMFSD